MIQPRAFTLVETLVAIAILMVAIIGPFMELERTVIASYVARDTLIGNSLAQEGMEYVLSIRDGNYLYNRANPLASPQRWFVDGLDGTAGSDGNNDKTITVDCFTQACYIDPKATTVTNVPSVLYDDTTSSPSPTYLYNQQSIGTATRFTRKLNLCYMQTDGTCAADQNHITNEVRVTVTVTWSTEGIAQNSTIVDYIQNWL